MNSKILPRLALFVCIMAVVAYAIFKVQTHRDQELAAQAAERQRLADKEAANQKAIQDAKVKEQEAKAVQLRWEAEKEAARQKAVEEAARRRAAEEAARQKAAQEAAAEHAKFVAQYVNTNFTRRLGLPFVAVMVADENNAVNHAMGAALISRFKDEHVQLVDTFFKPPLISDGLFGDAFNGSTALFDKLEIRNLVDGLLLARQTVQFSTNADLNNVITANMRCEIITLPVAGQVESRGWTFMANGTGFRQAEARMQAEERIIKQMADSSEMSLGFATPSQ